MVMMAMIDDVEDDYDDDEDNNGGDDNHDRDSVPMTMIMAMVVIRMFMMTTSR